MGIVKKILSTIVILALLLSGGIAVQVAAQGEVIVSINAPDACVTSEGNFTATVDIGQVEDFDACNYDVSFDDTVLRLDDVTSGDIGGEAIPVDVWNEISPGTFTIVQNVSGLTGANGTGYLAVLHFHVIGSPGDTSEINLSNGTLSNILAEEIPAAWIGDLVDVCVFGADFSIQPSTQTVGINQTFTVDIKVDASIQEVDTVEAYVDFDTTYLKVVNADGNIIDGTANDIIIPGEITNTNLTTKLKNQVDNDNGYADIAFGMPPGGTPANEAFVLGTIRFRAMAETTGTTLTFHTAGLRNTMAIRNFADVTGTRIGGSVAIIPEVQLRIAVTLQGRPPSPDDQWIIPVTVWLHAPGEPWTEAEGNGSLYQFDTQTSNEGIIQLMVVPGTYDIRVKGLTTLKNLVSGVEVIAPGPVEVNLGTLIEGDVNGDNMVTGLDYSAVIMCFGYAVDDPDAPVPTPMCDFNNDGYVTGLDYSAVIMNFGLGGADIE